MSSKSNPTPPISASSILSNGTVKATNGTPGLDLVQIRWQQIREMEFYQKIQQENVDLKLEIQKLERDLKQLSVQHTNALAAATASAKSSNTSISSRVVEMIQKEVSQCQQQSYREIQKLKEMLSASMTSFISSHSTLFQCNKKFHDLFQQTEHRVIQLKKEKQQCQQTVVELKQELSEQKLLSSSELTSLEKRCDKLLQERNELKEKLQLSEESNLHLRQELLSHRQEKEEWASTYEVCDLWFCLSVCLIVIESFLA